MPLNESECVIFDLVLALLIQLLLSSHSCFYALHTHTDLNASSEEKASVGVHHVSTILGPNMCLAGGTFSIHSPADLHCVIIYSTLLFLTTPLPLDRHLFLDFPGISELLKQPCLH